MVPCFLCGALRTEIKSSKIIPGEQDTVLNFLKIFFQDRPMNLQYLKDLCNTFPITIPLFPSVVFAFFLHYTSNHTHLPFSLVPW